MVFSIKLHIGRKQFEWASPIAHYLRDLNQRLESATTTARNHSLELARVNADLQALKEELGVGSSNTVDTEFPLGD